MTRSNKRSNGATDDDVSLFTGTTPRHPAGRVRIGLDRDAKAAAAAGARLSGAGLAALRSLADQIDQLERQLRSPAAGPYDRVPLAGLVREFRETYDTVFATVTDAEDPLARALAEFAARHTEPTRGHGGAAVDDAPDPGPAD